MRFAPLCCAKSKLYCHQFIICHNKKRISTRPRKFDFHGRVVVCAEKAFDSKSKAFSERFCLSVFGLKY